MRVRKLTDRDNIPTTLFALIRPPAIGSLLKRFPEISRQVVTNYPGNTLMPGARELGASWEVPAGTVRKASRLLHYAPVPVLNYRNIDGHVERVTYGYSYRLCRRQLCLSLRLSILEKAILMPRRNLLLYSERR